ncbi:MAG: hypothetical protein DRJ63_01360 [Thermoprotei archaeon]|nr:MAG: hypothetical protein DRJ63_01360 [Thermoprotei archaeon]
MAVLTKSILDQLGYEYYWFSEKAVRPDGVKTRFADIIPELSTSRDPFIKEISHKMLYRHQLEAFESLLRELNIILRAGTGSGKTEAWLLYSLKYSKKTLAVYPTLALANDQIKRIKKYASALGIKVVAIDAKKKEALYKELGSRSALKKYLSDSTILVTNPAFLLQDLKKWSTSPRATLLLDFLRKLDLIVLDEFDFYGPREIALLFSMIRIIKEISEKSFQLCLLTATLANAEEIAEFFSEITGNKSIVIEGKPFKSRNYVYVILGKNIEKIWSSLRSKRRVFEESEVGKDVLESLEDFNKFKKNLYKVISVAEALGVEMPAVDLDPIEILEKYIHDKGVTIVFTRSIVKAEEITRRLKHRLPQNLRDRVWSHHHLISKDLREKIEEGARRGTVKIIVSPRTLSQGIDIGTVIRIVHLGLPDDVKEFRQREGRKGRRENIEFTESIIIPYARWDRDLLSRGVDVLKSWVELPLEKTIVNPRNKYSKLFEALFKFVSPHLRKNISEEEYSFLRELGLVKKGELNSRGKRVWLYLNFYEFSPPYGIKRVKEDYSGESYYLEDISHCDLVEKFQIGCLDYTSDSLVTEHRLGGKTGRIVTAVVVKPLSERVLWKHEGLAEAYEEYSKIKSKWGEEPKFVQDYFTGRIQSEVLCVVYPPRNGFGKLLKIPNRVVWYIRGRKPLIKNIAGRTIVFKDVKTIPVPTVTHGKYTDYTYGITVELDPSEDLTVLRMGLAYLMLVLRKVYGIAFETIMYDLAKIGEKKLMNLHEPESAGLLEKLDWSEVLRAVENYVPEELDEILLLQVDEIAYLDLVTYDMSWSLAKKAAQRAVEYLLLREKISVKVAGREIYVPKPSKALKLAVVDALEVPLVEELKKSVFAIGVFDGEEYCIKVSDREYWVDEEDTELVDRTLSSLLNKGFKILLYSKDTLFRILMELNQRSILVTLTGLESLGEVVDVQKRIMEKLELNIAPLEELEKALGLERKTSLREVLLEASLSQRAGRKRIPTKYLKEKLEEYLKENLRNIYLLYLITEQWKQSDC